MIYAADLHMHSNVSDGEHSPSRLVELAKEKGIEAMAVTDHDSVDGVAEAMDAGKRLGVKVIQGVELSADDCPNLHILGYGFDPAGVNSFLDGLQERRDARKHRILAYLRGKGIVLDLGNVEKFSQGSSIGRPHFAAAMVEAGFVKNRDEAFARYLDTPEFRETDRGRPSAEVCVRKLKEAGGIVSLAHPGQIALACETLEELVERLANCGLDAIECRYTTHTPEQTEEYLRLARKYHLQVTGGSDFHGERVRPEFPMTKLQLELGWLFRYSDGDIPFHSRKDFVK